MMTGCCKYCGQFIRVDAEMLTEVLGVEDLSEAEPDVVRKAADEIALDMCTCFVAINHKEQEAAAERATAGIDALIREDYPNIADMFDTAVMEIAVENIKSIVVDNGTGIKFKMSKKKDGIAVERIETNKRVLEA